MQHVYKIRSTSIPNKKAVVEDFVECVDPAIIRKACASARTRFEMMIKENGGRFEHKKTALKPLMDGDHCTDFIIFVITYNCKISNDLMQRKN